MLDHRNKSVGGHILTIEDPIEFVFRHNKSIVSQREVGIDTLSYENALREALREAPEVIMIGEARDAETMKAAIDFADTGHLCLTTLHAVG
jgi:twitching motility protein PilU